MKNEDAKRELERSSAFSSGNYDAKQESIIYQNQSHLALALLIHNSKGEKIDPKEVVELTLKFLEIAKNPQKYRK